jgi:hypothetical protein
MMRKSSQSGSLKSKQRGLQTKQFCAFDILLYKDKLFDYENIDF